VFSTFRDATRAVKLTSAALATAAFDARRLEAAACEGWVTLTELADTLTRDHGLPFKTAHAIATKLVEAWACQPSQPLSSLLAEISFELAGVPLTYTEEGLKEILSPRHFVQVRATFGGPAPAETGRAAGVARVDLAKDRTWCSERTESLSAAERRLSERSAAL
jgi:argininosuccinate lyase